MNAYTPDRWVIVEMDDNGEKWKRVFAGWYGGYLGSDSWKMSSNIISTIDKETHYEFHNESGSIYRCYKKSYGTTSYMHNIFNHFKSQESDIMKINITDDYINNERT